MCMTKQIYSKPSMSTVKIFCDNFTKVLKRFQEEHRQSPMVHIPYNYMSILRPLNADYLFSRILCKGKKLYIKLYQINTLQFCHEVGRKKLLNNITTGHFTEKVCKPLETGYIGATLENVSQFHRFLVPEMALALLYCNLALNRILFSSVKQP